SLTFYLSFSIYLMLRNAISDNHFTLSCLIDGKPQSDAIPVKATPADTIDDLKVLIHARLAIDILFKNLTLWLV
ncbi:hypothetical protein BGZ59_000695, partial [Podila verticillata]